MTVPVRTVANLIPVVIIVLAVVVLIGWYAHIEVLAQVNLNWAPMQFNTALAFLLVGIGLLGKAKHWRWVAIVCGGSAAVLGLASAAQYWLNVNFGIDELLMDGYIKVETSHPGRMAPSTGTTFGIIGIGILLSATNSRHARKAALLLGPTAATLGLVSLTGYFGNAPLLYGWGEATRMAIHTSIGMVLSGTGLTVLAMNLSRHRLSNEGPRSYLAIQVSVTLAVAVVSVFHALRTYEDAAIEQQLHHRNVAAAHSVELMLQIWGQSLARLADRVQVVDGDTNIWQPDAHNYLRDFPAYRSITLVDQHGQGIHTVTRPGQGTMDTAVRANESQWPNAFDPDNEILVSNSRMIGPVRISSFVVPVQLNEGQARALVVDFEPRVLFSQVQERLGDDLTITVVEYEQTIFGDEAIINALDNVAAAQCDLYGLHWDISAVPSQEFTSAHQTAIPMTILLGGLASALIAGWAIHSAVRARRREVEIVSKNRQLAYAYEQLEKRRQRELSLSRSNSELEQFAYVASHDLQEPLRAVSSHLSIIESECGEQLPEEVRPSFAFAIDGAHRMKALINDLLEYSRVDRSDVEFAAVSLDECLDEALVLLDAAVTESNAEITREPLPVASASARQITQLFQNLIGNALKFRGDAAPQIHIGVQLRGSMCAISVQDNGIGIEPDYADRIFKIFQRLHTREEYEGTGIGLAICKRIVTRHGGEIALSSAPGCGATFTFTLPLQQEDLHARNEFRTAS